MQNRHAARALLIEDDPETRRFLSTVLETEGYDVTATDSVFGAHALVRQLAPALIIVDLELPYRSGLSFLPQLKADAETAEIPVIVLSGSPDLLPPHRQQMATALLGKPLDPAVALKVIQKTGQRAHGPAANRMGG